MNYSIFKSRTVWTLVGVFVIGGLNAIVHVLPPDIQALGVALLTSLAAYFHINPSQTYNQPE